MRMGMCAYPYFCYGKIYIKEIMNLHLKRIM